MVATERSPSFSWYPKDWLSDVTVRTMSHAERAAYVDLLCFCWIEDTLPAEPKALAQLLGVSPRMFARWWPKLRTCFEEEAGRLRHRRLDQERADQAKWRASRAAAGRKGAARRWHSHGIAMTQPAAEDGDAKARPMAEHAVADDTAIAEPVPEQAMADDTAIDGPMLGNGIAVRCSQIAGTAREARNTHHGTSDSYHAVSRSVRAFLLDKSHLAAQDPPDWVELKEGAKDQCRADGVTWTHSEVIARAIDSELAKVRKGVGEVARRVRGASSLNGTRIERASQHVRNSES